MSEAKHTGFTPTHCINHAMFAAAVCAGTARWEPFPNGRGEVCCNGLRYATQLDAFGCPVLTDSIRAALAKASPAKNEEP